MTQLVVWCWFSTTLGTDLTLVWPLSKPEGRGGRWELEAQFFGEFSHWGFGLCILSSMGACNWEEVQRDIGLRKLLEGAQLIFVGDRLSKAQLFSWCAGPGDKLHWGPDPLWACH